ncbi:hypothetical protein PCANC_19300 [Puccinia coronata f. sp. avenae]|uniref:Uncharacterized protein n=1 Tax=Puccinia coronata f. sp. avenae TaxID=200324 RepID=A0A2N5ULX3_9BASI|nr:hypothetical protein PCANC_19300 [Puccinia coronata f. sp. avenae]
MFGRDLSTKDCQVDPRGGAGYGYRCGKSDKFAPGTRIPAQNTRRQACLGGTRVPASCTATQLFRIKLGAPPSSINKMAPTERIIVINNNASVTQPDTPSTSQPNTSGPRKLTDLEELFSEAYTSYHPPELSKQLDKKRTLDDCLPLQDVWEQNKPSN